MEISDTKSTNIIFFSVLGATFFVTAVAFILMFIAIPQGLLGDALVLPTDSTEDSSFNINERIEELHDQLEKYDAILADESLFLLINGETLPSDYNPVGLTESVANDAIKLNAEADKQLVKFISAAGDNDLDCFVIAGYKTYKQQEAAYKKLLQGYANAGYTLGDAEKLTLREISRAGESDFETGFAVQISDSEDSDITEFKKSALFNFAKENMYKYGFVLRYPEGKENITGKSFNPFVFRYVGFAGDVNHAQYMYENNLTIEEYYSYIKTVRANIQHEIDSISS